MKKMIFILSFVFLFYLVLSLSLASAYFIEPRSSFRANTYFEEKPEYTQYADEEYRQNINYNNYDSNLDSSQNSYDYRGPMYERKVISVDDFSHVIESDSGFFHSDSKNNVRHLKTTTMTEKYVGASESVYSSSQNNRITQEKFDQDTNHEIDGGFSFGKHRIFDSDEYSSQSYIAPYYYRPNFDNSLGFFNWRY